jgi:2'-5' RNA ligase
MNNLHRIFLAINLPEKMRLDFCAYRDRWIDLPANWTRPENLHVTLFFMGNSNDEETVEICKMAGEAAKRHEPFTLNFDRIVFAPPKKIPPRMVWIQGEKSSELGNLQKDLENSLCGLSEEHAKQAGSYVFAPHVTLARINQSEIRNMDPETVPNIDEDAPFSFLVESVEVMESELKKGGPVYTILESARLGE